MKKLVFLFFSLSIISTWNMQGQQAYDDGEWLKFRIHYGWFNASFATLEVKKSIYKGDSVFHVFGRGKSTGLLDLFFKVDDDYQSIIRATDQLPVKFIRKINEGGYTKNRRIYFNQEKQNALVHDLKRETKKTFPTKANVQDLISVFYFFRNQLDIDNLKENQAIEADLFFDDENYRFKTVYLGKERIKTKYGKVEALKFRPYVQAGRVFEEEESLTLWVSNDQNKIPLKIKAKLAVGSLEADLDGFKNLKHPTKVLTK